MTHELKIPKKLIEVALPLDAINAASAREKSIRHGHPSTIHLWWARRPLAAARAMIFAQMVNDPGYERRLGRGMNKADAQKERERLFSIIERLVKWENSNDKLLFKEALEEIWKSWRETCRLNADHPQAKELFNPENLPEFHDPFAGGGSIPLEAQRFGLRTFASDLNPVAVLINKSMIDLPSRFLNQHPVGPCDQDNKQLEITEWQGTRGLAEDIRRYGKWVFNEAFNKIGNSFPKIEITHSMAQSRPDLKPVVGSNVTIIAWIWVRTVRSPNPAFSQHHVPLASTFVLGQKEGKEAYIEPCVEGETYHFNVKSGDIPESAYSGTKTARGSNFKCLLSGSPIDADYIKSEGCAGRIGTRLLAIVGDGPRGRIYLSPNSKHQEIAENCEPLWRPTTKLPNDPRSFWTLAYGITSFGQLFTNRQLLALNTFTASVRNAVIQVEKDALAAGLPNDDRGLEDGGSGALAYAQALSVYLTFAIDKMLVYSSSFCPWLNQPKNEIVGNMFGRQGIPMIWDFAEANVFAESSGNLLKQIEYISKAIANCSGRVHGTAVQQDAVKTELSTNRVVSTDPPYYDNIPYADLSEIFYVWQARALKSVFPDLYSDREVPKDSELVAAPYRKGGRGNAEKFFMDGMTVAMKRLSEKAHPAFPVTIYYAFKQSETTDDSGTTSSGWVTFLEAVLSAGFAIVGTWPLKTERPTALKASVNALASSILLVCRKRTTSASIISRRDFIRELNATLPDALEEMTRGGDHSPIAPVDLSQAIIGPGMEIFSKYSAVLEADGSAMSVKTALSLINRFLAEDDFDHDTQFCLQWFEANGWQSGRFGDADVLARAKGTSVDGLAESGVLESSAGNIRLYKPKELSLDWRPEFVLRVSVWGLLHNMILAFNASGESAAGRLLSRASQFNEAIRTLAYRLYTICERKGWAQDAGYYDSLVRAWDAIESEARSAGYTGTQISLFDPAPSQTDAQVPAKTKSRKKK